MPLITNFAEAQDALRPLYNTKKTRMMYDLSIMRALMSHLGNPQNKLHVVHVAGTSGKTSTAYYAASLLSEQGLQVGLSVSPHVDTINERLQINGKPLPEAEYCSLLGEFLDIIADCAVTPSYFETLTALAYWELARRGVDYAVIEVGLGGELDATNVITRADKVCLITDIGYDHTEVLGKTLDKIAWQKAGIIGEHNAVFTFAQSPEVDQVIAKASSNHDSELTVLPASASVQISKLPPFQRRNLGLALAAINYINRRDGRIQLSDAAIARTARTLVPARLEIKQINNQTIILDGSHNQQKVAALMEGIQELLPNRPVAALVSFMAGDSERWQGALDELLPHVEHIIFTSFSGEKDFPKSSADPLLFQGYASEHPSVTSEVIINPSAAFAALRARSESILLVTGSFYLMNHIRPLIELQQV